MSGLNKSTEIASVFLRILKNDKKNRYFEYYLNDDKETGISIRLNSDLILCFYENEIYLQLQNIEILILNKQGLLMWSEYDIDDRILFGKNAEDMSEKELAELLYEIVLIFAGVSNSNAEKNEIYRVDEIHTIYYYDVYLTNYYSLPYTKEFSNLRFHINKKKPEELECTYRRPIPENKRNDIMYYRNLAEGFNNILVKEGKAEEKYYWHRATRFVSKKDERAIQYINGEDGDFFIENNENGSVFHFRNAVIYFSFRGKKEYDILRDVEKSLVFRYDMEDDSAIQYYEVIGRIKLLFTGAGNISYEERKDGNGNNIGYNIYVEKEYDETYTKKIGNFVFHVNDGYQHKNETERLEDFLKDNVIKEISDIPGMIRHPLQTTKASRFLCYKLVNNEIKTLYFNGKDGDFYLKANRDSLLLHCRDMAFVFGNHGKALNLVEEGDLVINYVSGNGSEDVRDIFTAAYGMIYILAGAGTVTHKASDLGQFVITIEKEYIEADTKKFGNIIFEVRQEIPECRR